ncbi:hypothetical protein K505DRAFT_360490 [Melanomma pulvis-pyrius CBS 109.77]|uniref:Uncharacterized protein n=1 Tax=Melanomma pulvis-pyrius CBS 109.77 TaxID=1314802 RepID=A0A6A6XFS3_9PLEO|nr:hypothetical protein K505DRAFT_360490 [Melanomma pulvis-pyrius CBS 109.77]
MRLNHQAAEDNHQQVIQQMQQMQQTQQQMQQTQQQMQQVQQQMQLELHQVRTDITTSNQVTEYNTIARLQNSGLSRSDGQLTALRAYATNADVPGFPLTPAALSTMSGPALDRVLAALSLPTTGRTADKKSRLSVYIGLGDA